MKLFFSGTSPYARKVAALLARTGHESEVERIAAAPTPMVPDAALAAANPLGKLPCLLLDDGSALFDSRNITRYLDARFAAGLYPAGDALWKTLALEALADGGLDAALLCVYEHRLRGEGGRSEEWLSGQRLKIARALDALEAHWLPHLSGPLDMGAIGVGCLLGYLDFRLEMGGWADWRKGRPGLAKWGEPFLAQPWMKATAPA